MRISKKKRKENAIRFYNTFMNSNCNKAAIVVERTESKTNPNINRCQFLAVPSTLAFMEKPVVLEREKAIAYGKQVALNRGDTESVDGMGDHDIIEVLMPEMVTRNPQKDHREGDSFINSLENMINNTNNSAEAGLLAIAMCMAGM